MLSLFLSMVLFVVIVLFFILSNLFCSEENTCMYCCPDKFSFFIALVYLHTKFWPLKTEVQLINIHSIKPLYKQAFLELSITLPAHAVFKVIFHVLNWFWEQVVIDTLIIYVLYKIIVWDIMKTFPSPKCEISCGMISKSSHKLLICKRANNGKHVRYFKFSNEQPFNEFII